jgi:hypothetical protein
MIPAPSGKRGFPILAVGGRGRGCAGWRQKPARLRSVCARNHCDFRREKVRKSRPIPGASIVDGVSLLMIVVQVDAQLRAGMLGAAVLCVGRRPDTP